MQEPVRRDIDPETRARSTVRKAAKQGKCRQPWPGVITGLRARCYSFVTLDALTG